MKVSTLSFIDKTIKVRLPDRSEEPNLFDLFRTHQTHAYFRTCWKMVEINASFHLLRKGQLFATINFCSSSRKEKSCFSI